MAQARRTRDLWAGSFLLSYLAGHAMYRVLQLGGAIGFPRVHDVNGQIEDPLLQAIKDVETGHPPRATVEIASLPNRFFAFLRDTADPASLRDAALDAWRRIANTVWDQYVRDVAVEYGHGTEEIWKRQVEGFWEIVWVAGLPGDSSPLQRRKSWRTYVPTTEPGDKCTLMGDLQELSGHVGSRQDGRERQKRFWEQLRARLEDHLDLDEDERLSGIALIKRLFPRVAEKAVGWRVSVGYPSTVYLSAVPWITTQAQNQPERAVHYARTVTNVLGKIPPEAGRRLKRVTEALAANPNLERFLLLDGNCFFADALCNPRNFPTVMPQDRRTAVESLEDLEKHAGESPVPFYALVLMDGDNMGALLGQHDPAQVSAALARFTARVQEVVAGNSGVLVYAGGDDVLALFPLPDALSAVAELRNRYVRALESGNIRGNGVATISGAIVYAHYHAPLQQVYRWAHQLLDGLAKDMTGRDALAIGVWQSGGPTRTWSVPWPILLSNTGEYPTLLHKLASRFQAEGASYTSRFFYKIRERFELLNQETSQGTGLEELDPVRLLVAEYMKSRGEWRPGPEGRAEAEALIHELLLVARRYSRPQGQPVHVASRGLYAEGPLLVKFLSQRGMLR